RRYIESRGGTVLTGSQAAILIQHEVVEAVYAAGNRWTVGAAIAAVPWFALAELLRGDTSGLADVLDSARATAGSPIVSVNLWFDRPIIEEPLIGLPGRQMQWLFDKRPVLGPSAPIAAVSSGARSLMERSNGEVIETARAEIVDALPEARQATLLRASVV